MGQKEESLLEEIKKQIRLSASIRKFINQQGFVPPKLKG